MANETVGSAAIKLTAETEGAVKGFQKADAAGQVLKKTFSQLNAQARKYEEIMAKWAAKPASKITVRTPEGYTLQGSQFVPTPPPGGWGATPQVPQRTAEQEARIAGQQAQAVMAERRRAAAAEEAAARINSARDMEIGTLEQLKISLADAKLNIDRLTDPKAIEATRREIERLEIEIRRLSGTSGGLKTVVAEQRQMNLAARQGVGAFMGLALILNNISGDNTDKEMTKVNSTLQKASMGAMGAYFAMTMLGEGMHRFAGPVAGAVAGLMLITTWIHESNRAASEATQEGIKEFTNALKAMGERPLPTIKKNIQEEIFFAQTAYNDLFELIETGREGAWKKQLKKGATQEEADALREYISLQQDLLDEVDDRMSAEAAIKKVRDAQAKAQKEEVPILQRQAEEMRKMKEEIQGIMDKGGQGTEAMRVAQQKMADMQKRHTEELMGTDAANQQITSRIEAQVALGRESLTNLRAQLVASLAATTDVDRRLQLQKQIKDVDARLLNNKKLSVQLGLATADEYEQALRDQIAIGGTIEEQVQWQTELLNLQKQRQSIAALEVELGEKTVDDIIQLLTNEFALTDEFGNQLISEERALEIRTKIYELGKKQLDVEQKTTEQINKAVASNIANKHEREMAILDIELDSELKKIDEVEEEARKQKKLTQEQEQRFQEWRDAVYVKYTNDQVDLEKKKEEELQELRISLMKDDEAKIRAKAKVEYDELKSQREAGKIDEEEFDLRSRKIRLDTEKEVADAQLARLDGAIDGIDKMGAALHRAFSDSSSTFLEKMLAVLQIALQIERAIRAANSAKGGAPSGFDMATSAILTAFGMGMSEGGYIPEGGFVINEQQAGRYKRLLDKLGASVVRGGKPHTDSVVGKTKRGRMILLTPGERILPPELAPIGAAINEASPQGPLLMSMGGVVGRSYFPASMPSDTVPLLQEIQALRREQQLTRTALANMKVTATVEEMSGRVSIDNGQLFLRKELPDAQRFQDKKTV